jgi:hypothetical protein
MHDEAVFQQDRAFCLSGIAFKLDGMNQTVPLGSLWRGMRSQLHWRALNYQRRHWLIQTALSFCGSADDIGLAPKRTDKYSVLTIQPYEKCSKLSWPFPIVVEPRRFHVVYSKLSGDPSPALSRERRGPAASAVGPLAKCAEWDYH